MSDQSRVGGQPEPAQAEADRLQAEASAEARDVTDTAKDQAQRVAEEARQQARSLAREARELAEQEGEQQAARLSEALHEWSAQADALLEGRPDQAGELRDWTQQASNQLEELAERVDELGFRGLVDEVQRFARRRPGAFLLGAAVAGFGVARLGRGGQAAPSSPDRQRADRSTGRPGDTTTGATGPRPEYGDQGAVAALPAPEDSEAAGTDPLEESPGTESGPVSGPRAGEARQ